MKIDVWQITFFLYVLLSLGFSKTMREVWTRAPCAWIGTLPS